MTNNIKSKYGWICSRCEKSNAPHINSCDCQPQQYYQPYIPITSIIPNPPPSIIQPTLPGYPFDWATICYSGNITVSE